MTPEEAVAHKAQEQFDEYEREIAALLEVAERVAGSFIPEATYHGSEVAGRIRAALARSEGPLRAALAKYEQALTRIAAPPTDRDGIGVTARAIATAALAPRSDPDSPDPEYHEHGPLSWEKRDDVEAWRCDVCGAFPVPIGVDEERHAFADGLALGLAATPSAEGLDVERLADAMDEAYEYVEEYVAALPFVDDHDGFWRPFAAKVLAALAPEQPE